MNYNSSCGETVVKFQSALKEYRSFKSTKAKKMAKIDIGDATVSLFSKNHAGASLEYILSRRYEGTRVLIGCAYNTFYIYIRSQEEDKLAIPCLQIVSCNMSETTILLHFKEDFVTDRCIIQFFAKEQVDMFMKKLPPIERPGQEVEESSDSDFNDTGNARTTEMNNSSEPENFD